MLATTGQPVRDAAAWSYEVKWDGWRALVYVDGGLKVRTRRGRQIVDSLPELAGLVDALDAHSAILDGELVALVDGRVDFYALAPRCPTPSAWLAGWRRAARVPSLDTARLPVLPRAPTEVAVVGEVEPQPRGGAQRAPWASIEVDGRLAVQAPGGEHVFESRRTRRGVRPDPLRNRPTPSAQR